MQKLYVILKNVLLRSIWAFSLIVVVGAFSLSARADTIYRPATGGYPFGTKFYIDASALAIVGCGSNAVVDHLEYIDVPLRGGPDVSIFCGVTDPGRPRDHQYVVLHWMTMSYIRVCIRGALTSVNGVYQCAFSNAPIKDKPCQKCPSSEHGNPINSVKKEKKQIEIDFDSGYELKFIRSYSSVNQEKIFQYFSPSWRHNFSLSVTSNLNRTQDYKLVAYEQDATGTYQPDMPPFGASPWALFQRADGYSIYFHSEDVGKTWSSDADVSYKLSTVVDSGFIVSYKLILPNNDIENYNSNGKLVSIIYANGRSLFFSYSDGTTAPEVANSAGLMLEIRDEFGRKINLTYDSNGRVSSMKTPNGNIYNYLYDNFSNLSSVTYPDGLRKFYHYNEPLYQLKTGAGISHLLTGISFELTPDVISRFAIFRYDTNGNPISTEHAGGVDKFLVDPNTRYVTDPLGTIHRYGYSTFNGVELLVYESKPFLGSTVARTFTYDASGNFSSYVDYNNNKTTYVFDTVRNLEKSRIEAAGTSIARTITTEWHPIYRLPSRIAEPLRITSFEYDENGKLLKRSVQATTDANGTSAFTATTNGSPRVWEVTYNSIGQILTSKGPQTSLDQSTKYTYDDLGNLKTVTNPLGHQTELSNYDDDGRVGKIVDPNGLVTELTYTRRGLLNSRSIGGEITAFQYNGADKITSVTFPDGSQILYSYDAALRLIGIKDSLGNNVIYILDNAGNRINEQVNDSNGVLMRKITKVYDALGLLQKQTGGIQ